MAERLKDAEDRLLESMFETEAIADDGFSDLVVKKVRRRLWLRRLTLPVAAIIGGTISVKPLTQLVIAVSSLSSMIPGNLFGLAATYIPQGQTVILGAILLAVCMLGVRAIED